MSNPTPAQEEFAAFVDKNNHTDHDDIHPEDRDAAARDAAHNSEDEEDRYRAEQIEAAMRMTTLDSRADLHLPQASFDSGHATGVKGVIADARSYENARRTKWKDRVRNARRSVFGLESVKHDRSSGPESDGSGAEDPDEASFLEQWRESRRRELEAESMAPVARNRRTSPSLRLFGRFDEVDALGYLDAIEKVGRDTTVLVFVYDHESMVSSTIESALSPLVGTYPTIHFVKVHYEDIEFDNAGVPAILAYRNQGDLFANLTGLIEMLPDHEEFDTDSLKRLFHKHNIL
ncbi:thioredoxin-like protein [Podospora didyma]|uniref:Thioredoxin-like protein n=1 Tax=Podospora didyma TaxID=330526 RepID=A0AAE0N2U0_9PEZI|nr:thioredoxin-like protein [Podospora didyma]